MAAERPTWAFAVAGVTLLLLATGVAWWMHRDLRPRMDGAGSGELPPGELAGTLMLGGFRGLAGDVLWMRATEARSNRRTYESVALATTISRLQPRFVRAWEFLAWDQAYNLAADEENPKAKLAWLAAGVRSNVDGVVRNPGQTRLITHLAWMIMHRVEHTPGAADRDWSGDVAPAFAACLALIGATSSASIQPTATYEAPYLMSARLYRLAAAVAQHQGRELPTMNQRMEPLAIEREADRLRNLGRHREAFSTMLSAYPAWERIADTLPAPGAERWDWERDAYDRNEGRLRRKAAELGRQLASDPQHGAQLAAALMARNRDDIARLSASGLRERIERPTLRWLDE